MAKQQTCSAIWPTMQQGNLGTCLNPLQNIHYVKSLMLRVQSTFSWCSKKTKEKTNKYCMSVIHMQYVGILAIIYQSLPISKTDKWMNGQISHRQMCLAGNYRQIVSTSWRVQKKYKNATLFVEV